MTGGDVQDLYTQSLREMDEAVALLLVQFTIHEDPRDFSPREVKPRGGKPRGWGARFPSAGKRFLQQLARRPGLGAPRDRPLQHGVNLECRSRTGR